MFVQFSSDSSDSAAVVVAAAGSKPAVRSGPRIGVVRVGLVSSDRSVTKPPKRKNVF